MGKMIEGCFKTIGYVTVTLAMGVPLALLAALPVMLALGVLHNDVSPRVPALGFWATAIVLWGLGVVAARLRPPKRSS